MIIKQIKLSSQAKERLSRLKGKTGIKNWNILCRWALCYSLHEGTMPTDIPLNTDSNVEMSWFTFGGEYSDLYEALVKAWCLSKSVQLMMRLLPSIFVFILSEVLLIFQEQILSRI